MPNGTDTKTHSEYLTAKVRTTLGFSRGWKPDEHLGETLTHITVWSQDELNAVYERTGGTVTSRPVTRTACDGDATWRATEITLTVPVPGVGNVDIVTDWYEDYGGRDLPVVQGIPACELIA